MQKKNYGTNKKGVRLSKDIIPLEYDIQLKPDLENFTFTGIETIKVAIRAKTKSITIHSKDIDIETANISLSKKSSRGTYGGVASVGVGSGESGNSNKIFAEKISYNEKTETATFFFPQYIPIAKNAELTLVFQGILNDRMRGFYRSKYHVEGVEQHMATTQFEATDARRAFPCFDEPAHKAIFNVSLIIPKGHTAISNTLPVTVLEHEAGYEIVRFSPTPKMSTYLLAFIIGNFEFVEAKTNSGVLVRVFTTPGKVHQAGFALECTVKTLEFYEEYFDIPYPLPTLDMIAIPDFTSLAMENWGAITFREIGLLVDEKNTSISTKEMVAEVIAHELAHQWFGNLVTMEWWTHLWLNEGFASYIPYLAIEKIFPEWNIWERFTTDTLNIALRLDSLKNTHPIEVEVHHPDEISEIFDAVSYSKGASVIAMLADFLGEKDFRDGLRHYLKKHSYKNTETLHLWQALGKVSKKPVAKMMKQWTSKGGYPVVKAEIEKGKLAFSQERFFSSAVSKKKAGRTQEGKTIWPVPVSYGTNVDEKRKKNKILLSAKKIITSLPRQWVKVNLGESGFFRTAYSSELLEKLRAPIEEKILPSYDRLGVVRDLFALSEAGIIPTEQALEFLSSYKNEDSYVVWVEISRGLAQLEQVFAKTNIERKLRELNIILFSPLIKTLGWDAKPNEPNTQSLLRSLAIARLGHAGHKDTVNKARVLWNAMQNGEQIHPDIRSAIYTTIASNSGLKEYEIFIRRYKAEVLHEEQHRLGGALGNFPDPKILSRVCEFSISKYVRPQDTASILTLVSRYGEGLRALGGMLKAISPSAEEKHLKSFKKFFKSHNAPGADRTIEQIIERMESNVEWLKRDKNGLAEFLGE